MTHSPAHDMKRWRTLCEAQESAPTNVPMIRSGPGWQSVAELVDSAYSALDDMEDEQLDRFDALSPWRKVAYRYVSADCDNFAVGLYRITGWQIVGNAAHRLVQGPRGLIDASGWVTPEKLKRRYQWWSEVGQPGDESMAHSHNIGDVYNGIDHILAEVVSAIRQFPWSPYNTQTFQKMSFRPIQGVDTEDMTNG